jgi:imidazolonepropionase-like amidohydrolase
MATTLTGLKIWDGNRQLDANAIRIDNDRITAIGDHESVSASSEIIEFAGATAIPGLIDAHVHMVLDPNRRTPPDAGDVPDLDAMRVRAGQMLDAGITTARDLGGGHWQELKLRDEINSGATHGPRLLCAGQPVTSIGGHCHFWGGEAADASEIETVINRQLEHRVDLLKVMATGGRMTSGSSPEKPQFSIAELSVVVARADEAGLHVAAHCHGTTGIHAAACAGVTTIEHCSWVGEGGWASDYQADVAELIATSGIRVSPTVNAGWRRMIGNPVGDRVKAAFKAMIELGIPLIASTDAGIPGVIHHDLPKALAVFNTLADTSSEYTLASATSRSARALGIDHVTGSIQTGLSADLLIVDGDPLKNLSALEKPLAVWARGRRHR